MQKFIVLQVQTLKIKRKKIDFDSEKGAQVSNVSNKDSYTKMNDHYSQGYARSRLLLRNSNAQIWFTLKQTRGQKINDFNSYPDTISRFKYYFEWSFDIVSY